MKRWIRIGALLPMLSAAACGGGDEPAASNPTDGAASAKVLKDLTADEVQSECDALNARIALSKEDTCEYAGLMASQFGQACDDVKTQCMNAADQTQQPGDGSCMPPTDRRAGCSATIDDFEICMIAQADAIRALTCGSQLSAISALPAACDALKQKCPTFLDTEGQESPTP